MSSDVMITCKEDGSNFEGANFDDAFFIDEASMGSPWTEFGEWFVDRYCGGPSIYDQINGIKEHDYTKLEIEDYDLIVRQFNELETSKNLDIDTFFGYIQRHIGKSISVEFW